MKTLMSASDPCMHTLKCTRTCPHTYTGREKKSKNVARYAIPAVRKQRPEDCCKFEANLVYIGSSSSVRTA